MELATARSAIARAFPDLGVRSVRPLRGGWDFLTFEVDRRWIFRIPSRPPFDGRLRREFGLLPLLARRLPVPVPEYRLRAAPSRAFPHRIGGYPKLGGIRVDRAGLSPSALARVGSELGRAMHALHHLPADRATAAGLPFRSPRTVRDGVRRWSRRVTSEVRPLLDPRSRARLDGVLEQLVGPEFPSFRSVVTHNDLLPVHVLVQRRSGAITGLIDWGDVEFGDPAFDFGVMGAKPYLGPSMYRAYGGPSDPGFLRRADAYRRLVPSHAVIHATSTRNPGMRAESLRRFVRALASPGPAATGA